MLKTCGWIGPRLAVVALVLGLAAAPTARAAAIDSSINDYTTSGQIDPANGVSGPNVIAFNSVAGGAFRTPSAFSLGEFVVSPLPDGTTTTYEKTPFSITYIAQKVNGDAPKINETPLTITGTLSGKVTGANQSSVVASFDPIKTDPSFRAGDFLNTLKVSGSVLLVPSTNNGGRTTVQGEMTSTFSPGTDTSTVPEPATIAVFLMAGVGLRLRQRLRSRVA